MTCSYIVVVVIGLMYMAYPMVAGITFLSLPRLRPYPMRDHRLMTFIYDHALAHALVCAAARNGGQAFSLRSVKGTLSNAKASSKHYVSFAMD